MTLDHQNMHHLIDRLSPALLLRLRQLIDQDDELSAVWASLPSRESADGPVEDNSQRPRVPRSGRGSLRGQIVIMPEEDQLDDFLDFIGERLAETNVRDDAWRD